MASFKGYDREEGQKRRHGLKKPRRQGIPGIEFLENRQLLTGGTDVIPPPLWTPTSSNLLDAQNGPMANLGASTVAIYKAYLDGGGNTSELAAEFPTIEFENGLVGLSVKSLGGDFSQFESQLTNVGMQITDTSALYAIVDGYVPINELPTVAELPQTQSGMVQYAPMVSASEYQGVAYNESETAMFADAARTQFNVDGTGQTVGVLSDSVNQFNGGLAASYATGDLSATNPVTVLQDLPGGTDEGRAMMENIHDVAPGASLKFATGATGETAFGQNIQALATAGSNIIVDDIGYADEPMFQDGIVAQGVNAVVAKGVSYFSAAGNEGPDSGYLSTFRPSSGNITGIGAGTYMNFDPSGNNIELPVTTGIANALITFQFDQPYQFQEPAGSPGVVSSQVNIYVINASTGAIVVGAAANQNNVAAQQPWQFIEIPTAGSYFVAVQVVSGANPGHIEFAGFNDTNGAVTVSTTYGSAGGTSYPSTFGHAAAAATIGVGATPWWAPPSSLGIGQNPLANEPFSSSGPALTVFSPTGVALATPTTVENPSITAPDGGNTSFFSPGFTLDTSNPPAPGQPASSTNLVPTSQLALPVFFGTSSAAPNAAAVAALMLDIVPGLTPAQIRSGMETSAVPMNGQTQGTWIAADGFGFLNAINAINAINLLRVDSTSPANGATVTVSPSAITVTFNKPVNFSTVAAGDLTFLTTPSGVTVNVGTPIAVDNPTFPTIIQFPISFSKPTGTLANGTYSFSIQSLSTANPVESEDGKDLVPSGTIKFTLADTTSPVITRTTISGRDVTIKFNKAIDPATVTLANFFVLRQGTNAAWPPTAATLGNYTNLNSDPRATISYDPTTFTVTLDYSALPQTELPTDKYAIVVLSPSTTTSGGVTDLVGNPLFGSFSGVFPTGTGETTPQDFIQNLGQQVLVAPSITTFVMTPTASNDTGIVGDQNTNITNPTFIGQVFAPFPGTVAGLLVYIEFSSLHGGTTTLAVGGGGRGTQGTYDEVAITTSTGSFTVTSAGLLQGFQQVVAVVVGQTDAAAPLPGLASSATDAFRIDLTSPQVTGASFIEGGDSLPLPNGPSPNITAIPSLTTLTLDVVDPVTQSLPTLVTPSSVIFDALNPTTAQNISNYSLINTSQNDEDESQYIATATFVATSPTVNTGANNYILDYNGFINLTFLPGLPAGIYTFVAHTTELQYPGLTDAAGNPLNDTSVPGEGTKDFLINFDIQPQPVYITSMALESQYAGDGSTVIGTQQSYFELPPTTGSNTRDNVAAPPTAVVVDFSSPLPFASTQPDGSLAPIDYANLVQLIRSANTASGSSDGDFGTLGEGGLASSGSGFSLLNNYTVSLYNYDVTTQTWSLVTTPGEAGTRLVVQLNPGSTLSADDYRLYIPNQLSTAGSTTTDTRIFDIYGNQLDGENLGNQTSQASPDFSNPAAPVAIPNFEDLQSDGTNRQDDLSGDGVAGGAFMAAFTVVNYGNVIFARPDYVENPLVPSTLSNGSLANPFPVLAAEGNPNSSLAANPTHNPLLGLNNPSYFNPGALSSPNPYDFSGDGKYEQSALYAAAMLSFAQPGNTNGLPPQLGGPVIVVALPGIPQRSPITGNVTQATFVLQAPAGNNGGVTNGSASVPFNTTLVMAAGSTLKLQNADLYVQNQGSGLQTLGSPSDPVNFTSYNDATIGGAANNNPDTNPFAGDWGGIVFRNYNQSATPSVTFPVDGRLVGLNGGSAISGASDAMSIMNNAIIRYAGGAVPQGSSNFFSAITLLNSRPGITNTTIADTGGTGGTEAAIAADFDSFREDDTARGPLIRQVTVFDNSLNGLWLTSETNGYIEPTNAMTYPDNPATLGGVDQNYTFFEPLPFIVLAQLVVGQQLLVDSGGQTNFIDNRLYVQPGVMIKFNKGSALDVLNPGASLNVGSRSYLNNFDQDNGYNPDSSNFVVEAASDPQVLFTSLFDDLATTTLVPNPINVTGESAANSAAKLVPGAWGSVGIQSGAIAVINAATFTYGGGSINTPQFTLLSQSVLAFITAQTSFQTGPDSSGDQTFEGLSTLGTHAYITNNNFFHNFDSAMQIEPNGLMAGNPLTPLAPVDFTDAFNINNIGGGHPFFRGNVMTGNGIDGMSVVTSRGYFVDPNNNYQFIGPREEITVDASYVNQTVNAVWDLTDLTYVLRGTVVVAGAYDFVNFNSTTGLTFDAPVPNLQTFTAETPPVVSLTIQAALPGTLLANGSIIPSPGQSVIVKLLNDETPNGAGSLATNGSTGGYAAINNAGAGWTVGVDDGVDPPGGSGENIVDPGAYSEIRFLGIPGNQTTGQQRVPVIVTSLRDDTVGTTVRGVVMDAIANSIPLYTGYINPGASLTTPAAGDGGYLYIGGNSLTEYDPTNPFDGSILSNVDMSYMTRIEVQGGGIIDSINTSPATPGAPTLANTNWYDTLTGYLAPVTQINQSMMLTIADSNLSWFKDAAVFVHPDALNALYRDWTGLTSTANPPLPKRGGLVGEPVDLYMYNDTISNSGQGVHINSTTGDDPTGNTQYQAVLLNNTFYNDGTAIQTESPQLDGTPNDQASVDMLIMNNIFDGSATSAIDIEGQYGGTQIQYNLFFANTINIIQTSNDGVAANVGATYANPEFVGPFGPGDASAQNFELEPTSPAINAARSEIGPNPAGNTIYPTTTFINYDGTGGVLTTDRTDPGSLTFPQEPGRDGTFGFFGFGSTDPSQIVTLPGSGFFNFPDEFQPVLTTDPSGYSTSFSVAGTYNYAPISGQRDLLGYIRAPQPGSTGTGYGSNPFIDVGAYQYVNLHPPEVIGVTETPTQGATPVNFYATGAGNTAGANQTPWTINITFDGPISPNTINANTVSLVNLGSNPSQPLNQNINLAGKLSYDSATNTLIINLGAAGLTLGTDAYQITLFGSGSPVLTNLQGVALDGENTVGGTSTGAQLPLPSGNGYPGGNFFDSFIINTTPPAVLAGSLAMSPASDTNIVGDSITTTNQPTFNGTVSEANPLLVPLAGQTAILDIGIFYNGVTYFSTTGAPAAVAKFIRPNAGTALSTTGGAFSVTVGVDGANTGLVTNTAVLPDLTGTYNVGADGILSPLPGDDNGYYVARVRVIDQSGNQSNPADPNSQTPFIVDDTAPTVTVTSPSAGQVITSINGGVLNFSIHTSQNIDLTHFNASSILLVNAGPDGILGTADDVTIPIDSNSVKVTYLDAITGGPGAEQITFSSLAGVTLTNNLYQITLLNSGTDSVRDIAGNTLTTPVVQTFAVFVPSLAKNLFVEQGADVATANGSRDNPYATIGAAMTAASAGDVVAVLPGVYQEQVTMRQFVRLYSAAASSNDSTVFTTSTGDPLATVIRAPFVQSAPSGTYETINVAGLQSLPGLTTEIAGFTIASPLVGNAASGFINVNAVAVDITNSNVNLDKNYVIDAGIGVQVTTSGSGALTPQIFNDGIIGNIYGVLISDGGSTPSNIAQVQVINDTFAFNTTGLYLQNSASSPNQAYVASNIFWENHDQSLGRSGFAIYSLTPNKVSLQNNLFFGNGAGEANQSAATNQLGNGFSPTLLGTTAASANANLGNFVGNPAFVFPIDPRPGSDGPANFYIGADFQLTSISAAIDNAYEPTAKTTDFLGASQVYINGGLGLPNSGPRDIGAFEYNGTGGSAVGGSFRVVTTSLAATGGAVQSGGATTTVPASPNEITVVFSGNVNPADISLTDLVLSGSAISQSSPVHATSLTWIDAHTVEFNLDGQFISSGTLNLSIAANAIQSVNGSSNAAYSDSVVLKIALPVVTPSPTPTSTPTPSPTGTPTTVPVASPAPAAGPKSVPKGPLHKAKAVVHHIKKVVKHVVAHKAKPVVHKPVAKKVVHKAEAKVVHKAEAKKK